jgi:predicted dehydrogenase
MVHAPVFAAGPETDLVGVWARRQEAAEQIAGRHGAAAYPDLRQLFDACDAIAFAVPPDVQAALAVDAARAGKHLLLEKPIAGDLAGAERLAAAVHEAGIASMVVLSFRYAAAVREFLGDAPATQPFAGRARFVSGALLGGPFATPWRLERGALLDLGPHMLDLLDAALGEITSVRAHGNADGWVGVHCLHAGGAVSEASLCATVPVNPSHVSIELYGRAGAAALDLSGAVGADAFATMRSEFVAAARGEPHPLDVDRGLHLQRLLDEAERQLRQ